MGCGKRGGVLEVAALDLQARCRSPPNGETKPWRAFAPNGISAWPSAGAGARPRKNPRAIPVGSGGEPGRTEVCFLRFLGSATNRLITLVPFCPPVPRGDPTIYHRAQRKHRGAQIGGEGDAQTVPLRTGASFHLLNLANRRISIAVCDEPRLRNYGKNSVFIEKRPPKK